MFAECAPELLNCNTTAIHDDADEDDPVTDFLKQSIISYPKLWTQFHLIISLIWIISHIGVANAQIINWTDSQTKLPHPRAALMAFYDIERDDELWIVGGWDMDNGTHSDVYTLNMTSALWIQKTSLPVEVAVDPYEWTTIQNNVYWFTSISDSLHSYNIDNQEYKEHKDIVADIVADGWRYPCLTSYNANYLIMVGSFFQIYDFDNGNWSVNLPLLITPRNLLTCETHNDYLYVIGGHDGISRYLNTVEKINLSSLSTWIQIQDTLSTDRGFHTSIVAGDNIYIIGGFIGIGKGNTKAIDVISTLDDSITRTADMNYAISRSAVIQWQDNIWILGGRDNDPSDWVIDTIQISCPTPPSNPTGQPSEQTANPTVDPTLQTTKTIDSNDNKTDPSLIIILVVLCSFLCVVVIGAIIWFMMYKKKVSEDITDATANQLEQKPTTTIETKSVASDVDQQCNSDEKDGDDSSSDGDSLYIEVKTKGEMVTAPMDDVIFEKRTIEGEEHFEEEGVEYTHHDNHDTNDVNTSNTNDGIVMGVMGSTQKNDVKQQMTTKLMD